MRTPTVDWTSQSSRASKPRKRGPDTRKGRRPSFNDAAPPEIAEPVVSAYVWALAAHGVRVAQGRFGAHMQVSLVNDGPVTITIDSEELERPRRV
jgi:D-tyrosyl-tRNA(Tyr) deacylase